MDKWAEVIGAENMLNMIPAFLMNENPEQRMELLNWTIKNLEFLPKSDYKLFITPILNCLSCKCKEIRNLSEVILEKMINMISAQPFYLAMKDFKPATI